MRKGTAPMGTHINWARNQAGSPMAFRVLNFSYTRMEGSWITCDTGGRAARMPTCRLLAPSARA